MSKKVRCKDCFHAKTRVFRQESDLNAWMNERFGGHPNHWVKRKLAKNGVVRIYWCDKRTTPKIFLTLTSKHTLADKSECTPDL